MFHPRWLRSPSFSAREFYRERSGAPSTLGISMTSTSRDRSSGNQSRISSCLFAFRSRNDEHLGTLLLPICIFESDENSVSRNTSREIVSVIDRCSSSCEINNVIYPSKLPIVVELCVNCHRIFIDVEATDYID